ncbi:MAG: MFS transporter [Pseudomonadota bacterium]
MSDTSITTGQTTADEIQAAQANPQASDGEGGVYSKTGLAWAWFEWARNPYYILVVIYIFAPYFAGVIIAGDLLASGELAGLSEEEAGQVARAQGQATIASVTKWAGAIAGLTAPFLGAAFDRGLRRKPFLMLVLGIIAAMSFLLWWAQPGGQGLATWQIMGALIVAYVCYTYSEVTHNSMLPDAASPEAVPGVSGLGLSMGNAAATLLFIALVVCFFLPIDTGWPTNGPMFGLDPTKFEHTRIVGPLCALWLVLMIPPFFMYGKDTGKKGTPFIPALVDGAKGVIATIQKGREHKEAFKFLIARTIYADGMAALLALAAVYIALFLDWTFTELIASAISGSIFAVLGGYVGGFLDRRIGPKNALIVELVGIVIVLFIGLSFTKDSLFYGLVDNWTVWDGPVFQTGSDVFYLINGAFLAVFATANISSSRSMLVHVAPKHMRGEFFGLFAIAGSITVWLGPLMVELFTTWSNSQRVGMSAIALLFFAGLAVLLTVKDEPAKT